MENTQSKNKAFEDQIFQKNVLVQNFIGNPNKNAYLDFNLMELLSANEFFIYTYLLNAPEDFTPNYEKFAKLLKVSSRGTITNIMRKLSKLNLVIIEKMGTFYVWTVNYKETKKTLQSDDLDKEMLVNQTHKDRSDIMREIQDLEDLMANEDRPDKIISLLSKITELKGKLRDDFKKL